jgi:hypothetical protein
MPQFDVTEVEKQVLPIFPSLLETVTAQAHHWCMTSHIEALKP